MQLFSTDCNSILINLTESEKKKSINSRRGKSDKVELAKKLKKKRKRKGREGEKKGEINILEV